VQLRARPVALGEAIHATDQDVRPQAANVASECGDRAIGRHQQGQDIESIVPFRRRQPRIVAGRSLDECERFAALLQITVDEHAPLPAQRATQAQQAIVPPRGSDPFGADDPDRAVAENAGEANRRRRKTLSRQCLARIAPQAGHVQSHGRLMPYDPPS
jgi:hypothetical protein